MAWAELDRFRQRRLPEEGETKVTLEKRNHRVRTRVTSAQVWGSALSESAEVRSSDPRANECCSPSNSLAERQTKLESRHGTRLFPSPVEPLRPAAGALVCRELGPARCRTKRRETANPPKPRLLKPEALSHLLLVLHTPTLSLSLVPSLFPLPLFLSLSIMSPIKTHDQPPTHDAAVAVKPIKGAVRPLLNFSKPVPQLETDFCWVLLMVAQSEVEKLTIKAVRVLACELTQQVRSPLDHLRIANPLTLILFLTTSTREVTLERLWEPLPSASLSGSTRCASTPTTPTGSPEIVRSSDSSALSIVSDTSPFTLARAL